MKKLFLAFLLAPTLATGQIDDLSIKTPPDSLKVDLMAIDSLMSQGPTLRWNGQKWIALPSPGRRTTRSIDSSGRVTFTYWEDGEAIRMYYFDRQGNIHYLKKI